MVGDSGKGEHVDFCVAAGAAAMSPTATNTPIVAADPNKSTTKEVMGPPAGCQESTGGLPTFCDSVRPNIIFARSFSALCRPRVATRRRRHTCTRLSWTHPLRLFLVRSSHHALEFSPRSLRGSELVTSTTTTVADFALSAPKRSPVTSARSVLPSRPAQRPRPLRAPISSLRRCCLLCQRRSIPRRRQQTLWWRAPCQPARSC